MDKTVDTLNFKNDANLINPNAVIGTGVKRGFSKAIMDGAVINSSSRYGKGCIIDTCLNLDHDNGIEKFVFIFPWQAVGNLRICKGTWLGVGSIIRNNIKFFSNCKYCAVAVVVKDVTETETNLGVFVRKIS